jgi:hypothetical protein
MKRRKRKVNRIEELSEEEMARRLAEVRAGWSPSTEAARRGLQVCMRERDSFETPVEIHEVSWPDGIPKDVCERGFPF